MPTITTADVPRRAARAVVVAVVVTPAVVVAHLLTRGAAPGPLGLAAVVLLVAAAAFAAPRASGLRLAGVVVAAQVAAHAALAALTPGGAGAGCLPAVGRGAEAGLHLAMLRADATCAAGTYAAGPTLTALLGAVLTAALVVAAQLVLGGLAARTVTAGERLTDAVRALLAAVLPALPVVAPAGPVDVPARRTDVHRVVPVRSLAAPAPQTRRGPPAFAAS